jgi:hypothetical protein
MQQQPLPRVLACRVHSAPMSANLRRRRAERLRMCGCGGGCVWWMCGVGACVWCVWVDGGGCGAYGGWEGGRFYGKEVQGLGVAHGQTRGAVVSDAQIQRGTLRWQEAGRSRLQAPCCGRRTRRRSGTSRLSPRRRTRHGSDRSKCRPPAVSAEDRIGVQLEPVRWAAPSSLGEAYATRRAHGTRARQQRSTHVLLAAGAVARADAGGARVGPAWGEGVGGGGWGGSLQPRLSGLMKPAAGVPMPPRLSCADHPPPPTRHSGGAHRWGSSPSTPPARLCSRSGRAGSTAGPGGRCRRGRRRRSRCRGCRRSRRGSRRCFRRSRRPGRPCQWGCRCRKRPVCVCKRGVGGWGGQRECRCAVM